jgi:methionyl aminopeptidase
MTTYVTPTAEIATIRTSAIKLHGEEGFAGMRKAGRLAAEILDAIVPLVQPGVVTSDIDDAVRNMMLEAGAVPGDARLSRLYI